jgi:dihydrofolate synthase/folylpolyglutamate synthase
MELISGAFGASDHRDLLLDGAHNEDGAAALAAGINDLAPFLLNADGTPGGDAVSTIESSSVTLVVAAMADKSIGAMFSALAAAPLLQRARVICTTVGDGRSSTPDSLAAAARAAGLGAQVETAEDPDAALSAAARGHGAVIVAGSLYLVGAVRERLMREGCVPDDGSLDRLSTTA